MYKIGVVALFPELVEPVASVGVVGRARERGLIELVHVSPREFASDRHRTVDDRPYGGGPGMVLRYEPMRDAIRYLQARLPEGSRVKAGEVLARFDGTQLEQRMREHKAALETALQEKEKEERNLEVQLKQLRLDLVKAEGDLKELDVEGAVPEGLLSSIEVNQLKLRRELAQRKVDFLKEKIEFQKAIKRYKSLQSRVLKVETADKMTRNQMIAYVRNFYKNQAVQ